MVDGAAGAGRSVDAEPDRERNEQQDREQSEDGGVLDPIPDQARDRCRLSANGLARDGVAEIPLDEPREPVPVALRRRPVEMELLPNVRETCRRRVAAEHGTGDVTRQD